MALELHRLITGPLSVNTYLVVDTENSDCVVIDPADDREVNAFLEMHALKLQAVLLTHGHFDHILGVGALQEKHHVPVLIHGDDEKMLHDPMLNLGMVFGCKQETCTPDTFIDGDILLQPRFGLRVIHTPGHTPGSSCFYLEEENILFSGDTLFRSSYGRTDFPGGSFTALKKSISEKLFSLDGDIAVYPGHGEETNLLFEKANNPMGRG